MKLSKITYNKSSKRQKENFLQKTALFLIALYKCYGSPFLGGNCRFFPSCSSYAEKAFQEFPFKKAFFITLKRLFRCHPLSSHSGYHPLEKESL